MVRTYETRSILELCNRQKEFFSASFSNATRRVYVLKVIRSHPEHLQIFVRAPQGRTSPIDPTQTWRVTLWNHRGAYQTYVSTIESDAGFLKVTLQGETSFLARRKNIRLNTDSRNPTLVSFQLNQTPIEGLVMDFSPEGLGIETLDHQELQVGTFLHNGEFKLKGHHVRFKQAKIVQRSWADSRLRLGLMFQELTENQEELIQTAFHTCFSPVQMVSTVLDG